MMRRNWIGIGLIAFVLCLSVAFLTGCAKKATLKEGAVVTQEQKTVAEAPVGRPADSYCRPRSSNPRTCALTERTPAAC
jgi:hypothetical protein